MPLFAVGRVQIETFEHEHCLRHLMHFVAFLVTLVGYHSLNYLPSFFDRHCMSRIREVWAPTLEAEMRNIRQVIEDYPYIAMDTEFPGVVARPIGSFKTSSDYHYQTMRCNVDLLKIIQVGLTLANADGHLPPEISTWQFNFTFSTKYVRFQIRLLFVYCLSGTSDDMYSPDSIDLLRDSGIDFQRHEEIGIQPNHFAELLITSGLVLAPETRWISFHR